MEILAKHGLVYLLFVALAACQPHKDNEQLDDIEIIQKINAEFRQQRQITALPLAEISTNAVARSSILSPPTFELIDYERIDLENTLKSHEIKIDVLDQMYIVSPEQYSAINDLLEKHSSDASIWLDEEIHEYAIFIPADNFRFELNEQLHYPGLLIGWDGDYPLLPKTDDNENSEDSRERQSALFDELLPLLSFPIDDKPPTAPPQKQPGCTKPVVPDTDAVIDNAKARISKSKIHTNNPIPSQKQGDWARILIITQDGHHTTVNGQTILFYKAEIAEGCDITGKWRVGLKSIDVQFRILVRKNARPTIHPNERNGANKTAGGVEGTLGHETEHGEAVGKTINDMLKFRQTPGVKFKKLIEDMKWKSFPSQDLARVAAAKYQLRLEVIIKIALSAAATHSPPNERHNKAVYPRQNTAEKIDDPNQIKLTDRKADTVLFSEIKDLVSKHDYKPFHPPGKFGILPKPKKAKKKKK